MTAQRLSQEAQLVPLRSRESQSSVFCPHRDQLEETSRTQKTLCFMLGKPYPCTTGQAIKTRSTN